MNNKLMYLSALVDRAWGSLLRDKQKLLELSCIMFYWEGKWLLKNLIKCLLGPAA